MNVETTRITNLKAHSQWSSSARFLFFREGKEMKKFLAIGACVAALSAGGPAMADSSGRVSFMYIGGNSGCVYARVADDPTIYSIQKDAVNFPAMFSFVLSQSGGQILTLIDGGASSCPLSSRILSSAFIGFQTP